MCSQAIHCYSDPPALLPSGDEERERHLGFCVGVEAASVPINGTLQRRPLGGGMARRRDLACHFLGPVWTPPCE